MPLSVATWNINSVRLRIGLVRRFLHEHAPDVLCLQETKCPDGNFPFAAFKAAGYRHVEIHGQKGYHGVAIVSRLPLCPSTSAASAARRTPATSPRR
jgi:exodeoxyribonuclease-3